MLSADDTSCSQQQRLIQRASSAPQRHQIQQIRFIMLTGASWDNWWEGELTTKERFSGGFCLPVFWEVNWMMWVKVSGPKRLQVQQNSPQLHHHRHHHQNNNINNVGEQIQSHSVVKNTKTLTWNSSKRRLFFEGWETQNLKNRMAPNHLVLSQTETAGSRSLQKWVWKT